MSRDEVEGRAERSPRCNTRRVIVRGGLAERARERLPDVVANRGTIQPVDAMQRRQHLRHRPLALRRIGDRDARDLAGRVIAREHAIRRASPRVVPAVVFVREARHHGAPPRCGVRGDCVELDAVADRAFAGPRNAETHGGRAIELGEIEAALVELQPRERIRRSTRVVIHLVTRATQRVARVQICTL
jgi:hypothetical protein